MVGRGFQVVINPSIVEQTGFNVSGLKAAFRSGATDVRAAQQYHQGDMG